MTTEAEVAEVTAQADAIMGAARRKGVSDPILLSVMAVAWISATGQGPDFIKFINRMGD